MVDGSVILKQQIFSLTLERLTHQLIENYGDMQNVCLIGIQPRGVQLSDRIYRLLSDQNNASIPDYGKLDITFYRDDFRRRHKPLKASHTQMDFLVEDKRVILIDDVLYTGRTIQAALTALQHYGRPSSVELLVMVDRRFNRHLPIQPDYNGITVDAVDRAYVKVEWKDTEGEDRILIFSENEE